MKCQHKDCSETELIKCVVPASVDMVNDFIEYLCAKHASEQNYCWGCGQYYGGMESELNSSGLCEHCDADINMDFYNNEMNFEEEFDSEDIQ